MEGIRILISVYIPILDILYNGIEEAIMLNVADNLDNI
jgi:hypothetical protein